MAAGKAAGVFLQGNKCSYSTRLSVCGGKGRAGWGTLRGRGMDSGMLSPLGCKGRDQPPLISSPHFPQPGRAQSIPGEGFLDASLLGKSSSPSASFPAWSISHFDPICPAVCIWVSIASGETHQHPPELQRSSLPVGMGQPSLLSPQHPELSARDHRHRAKSHQPGGVSTPSLSPHLELPSHQQHACLRSCPGRGQQVGQRAPGISAGSICSSIPLQRGVLS